MPSRHIPSEPEASQKRFPAGKYPAIEVLDSQEHAFQASNDGLPPHAPERTLSPVSASAMNSLKLVTNTEEKLRTTNGGTDSKNGQKHHDSSMISRPSEKADNTLSPQANGLSISRGHPITNQPRSPTSVSPSVRAISSEFGPTRLQSREENAPPRASSPQPWSSAVGKANLGKSGRVIEQLMSQNDHLKKDLQLTKLQSEESRNEAKMLQGRMEVLKTEYEDMMHQVTVVETILKRKERQLGEYKDQIDGERRKTQAAVNSERCWREEMEKTERQSRSKIEEARNYALLTDGRYNALASHWKDQGEILDCTVQKLHMEINVITEERKQDRAQMDKLEVTCEQQAEELKSLRNNKDAISVLFKTYKEEQEAALKNIKVRAAEQERANDLALEETMKVLRELKWALAVKKNVKGAK